MNGNGESIQRSKAPRLPMSCWMRKRDLLQRREGALVVQGMLLA